jgi:hypothetical protein
MTKKIVAEYIVICVDVLGCFCFLGGLPNTAGVIVLNTCVLKFMHLQFIHSCIYTLFFIRSIPYVHVTSQLICFFVCPIPYSDLSHIFDI